jgi:16S rRNA (guanine1207-N2)-methyltransferase
MVDRALETLFEVLEREPALHTHARRVFFLRAVACAQLRMFAQKELHCHQTFKVTADALMRQGYTVTTKPQGPYDLCLYQGSKQKDENLVNFARSVELLAEGGIFLCALPKELGAARFEKELHRVGGEPLSFTRNHCRVFGARRGADPFASDVLASWQERGALQQIPGTDFFSQPGVFGWSKIDRGSELLCQSLPGGFEGAVADLGCGYGYIASHVLAQNPKLTELHLFEAEKLALDAAAKTLESSELAEIVKFHWHDVTSGLPRKDFSLIVTNPPFHTGKQVHFGLGEKFVEVAAKSLKPGGEFFMVANETLPYERVLEASFGSYERVATGNGFKVLKARRGTSR